jgi:hypothetical protein
MNGNSGEAGKILPSMQKVVAVHLREIAAISLGVQGALIGL